LANLVLWKRLSKTDFGGMTGTAAISTKGGGARHIALGVNTGTLDVRALVAPKTAAQVTIQTQDKSTLTLRADPDRRGGEWLVTDQANHRHPAWSTKNGFPTTYDSADPPVILIFRVGDTYHIAHTAAAAFSSLAPDLAKRSKGVAQPPAPLLKAFDLQSTALGEFEAQKKATPPEDFNPSDAEDGRKRVFAEIIRRQGQPGFRKKLMRGYGRKCVISGCAERWVLEAAHITPYRGSKTNAASNGLLLRADIHTLFDVGLISVDPDTLVVRVSARVTDAAYRAFHGKQLTFGDLSPSTKALRKHYSRFEP
jgi:hypothetical protein